MVDDLFYVSILLSRWRSTVSFKTKPPIVLWLLFSDYILISVYLSKRCRGLSSDVLTGNVTAQAFSILDSLFFDLGRDFSQNEC